MEALGAVASIVGLLAAAGKVVEVVAPVLSSLQDVAAIAAPVHAEVVNCRIILYALHGLLKGLDNDDNQANITPRRRSQLIQVEHLVSVLTDGVLLFSEIESLVLSFGKCDGVVVPLGVRMKWARGEKKVSGLLARLQCFKSTASLILNILQCESDNKASESQRSLESAVKKLLETNQELASRLARLESSVETASILTRAPSGGRASRYSIIVAESLATIPESGQPPPTRLEFEDDLQLTGVYQRCPRDSLASIERSARYNSMGRWSVYSDLSLSDISTISVLNLPISSAELTNSQHYEFDSSASGGGDRDDGKNDEEDKTTTVPAAQSSVTEFIPSHAGIPWRNPPLITDWREALRILNENLAGAGLTLYVDLDLVRIDPERQTLTVRTITECDDYRLRELAKDILDEILRRHHMNSYAQSLWDPSNPWKSTMEEEPPPPFLLPRRIYTDKRDERRRMLSTWDPDKMSLLATIMHDEIEKRLRREEEEEEEEKEKEKEEKERAVAKPYVESSRRSFDHNWTFPERDDEAVYWGSMI